MTVWTFHGDVSSRADEGSFLFCCERERGSGVMGAARPRHSFWSTRSRRISTELSILTYMSSSSRLEQKMGEFEVSMEGHDNACIQKLGGGTDSDPQRNDGEICVWYMTTT